MVFVFCVYTFRLPGSERGRRRKLFALEEIAYSADKNIIFEFGGLEDSTTGFLDSNQEATGLYSPLSLDAGGFLDAGGTVIGGKLWDLLTGENLRTNVDIPAYEAWNYTNSKFVNLSYLRQFRQYKVNPFDIALL